jgi:hypothetical protein
MGTHSWKLYYKIVYYPDFEGNPLGMLRYVKIREQVERVLRNMHFKIQELVRAEVGDRMEKDLEIQEKNELKGIFKLKITPQIEHLMKLSKYICNKTKFDNRKNKKPNKKKYKIIFHVIWRNMTEKSFLKRNNLINITTKS